MGFDVTFHPVAEADINRYVFDVAAQPALAEGRMSELSRDRRRLGVLMQLCRMFTGWVADPGLSINHTYAFAAAIMAGFLHPFWYARDAGITLLAESKVPEPKPAFTNFKNLDKFPHRASHGVSFPLFNGNESASGFIRPEEIRKIRETIDSLSSKPGRGPLTLLETMMDEDAIESLSKALDYCQSNKLGLIEASDVVIPLTGQSVTNVDNMRAGFLGNLLYLLRSVND